MPEYTVIWTLDVNADSPEDAAQIARELQLDPDNTATVFDVTSEGQDFLNPNVEFNRVDLNDYYGLTEVLAIINTPGSQTLIQAAFEELDAQRLTNPQLLEQLNARLGIGSIGTALILAEHQWESHGGPLIDALSAGKLDIITVAERFYRLYGSQNTPLEFWRRYATEIKLDRAATN